MTAELINVTKCKAAQSVVTKVLVLVLYTLFRKNAAIQIQSIQYLVILFKSNVGIGIDNSFHKIKWWSLSDNYFMVCCKNVPQKWSNIQVQTVQCKYTCVQDSPKSLITFIIINVWWLKFIKPLSLCPCACILCFSLSILCIKYIVAE